LTVALDREPAASTRAGNKSLKMIVASPTSALREGASKSPPPMPKKGEPLGVLSVMPVLSEGQPRGGFLFYQEGNHHLPQGRLQGKGLTPLNRAGKVLLGVFSKVNYEEPPNRVKGKRSPRTKKKNSLDEPSPYQRGGNF